VSDESNNVVDKAVASSVSETPPEGGMDGEHVAEETSSSMGPSNVGADGEAPLAAAGSQPIVSESGAGGAGVVEPDGKGGQEIAPAASEEEGAAEVIGGGSESLGGAGAQDGGEGEEDPAAKMDWYILKVQSNRERSISEALRRKIAIEGLEEYFGDVVVPTEKVTEFKGGKKKVVERKLYPGYIVVHMCINDDTWFAVRETSGIGDFTGSGGKPTPMLPHEVARIIHKEEEEHSESPKLDIRFKINDRVKIKEGTFEGFEGDVNDIDGASGRVTVMINIFSRSTPVELEYWQIESV